MAQENEIDSLSLDISVNSPKSNLSKIDNLNKKLDALADVIYDFPTVTFDKIRQKFVAFENAINTLTLNNKSLSGFTSRIRTLNNNISQMDFSVMETKFDQMTSAISPFISKATEAQDALVALNGVVNGSSKITQPKTQKKKKNTNDNSLFKIAKLSGTLILARKLGRVVSKIAQEGANYTETLNLWETAMGNNLGIANKFVDKMNEAYGVSEKTLMNAQATFKNMLGSLGQISDETAYRLSEGVTQMALDYASLYNQTFAQAMTKFQAALAGQVRPIRSVSGFDITENTLYQLYQSLGGEKTMRQLSRTEKQLLSIYAIFEQMEASGTIGDLEKTMESFANQSRVASEAFQEIIQYSGILITNWIEQSGLLVQLNGYLLFFGDILKGLAESTGAIKHFDDPFASTTEGALEASKATDELNGKLAGFDKFQSLSSSEQNSLGIDEKLLTALSSYDSILENTSMEAREIANALKESSKLFDENGVFDKEAWDDLTDSIKNFGIAIAVLIAPNVIGSLVGIIKGFNVEAALITGTIFAILEAVKAFKDGEYGITILATAIGVVLLGAFLKLKLTAMGAKVDLRKFYSTVGLLTVGITVLVSGISKFISSWDDMGNVQKAVGIFAALAGSLTAVAIAFHATHNWAKAIGIGALVAGGALMVTSALPKFADGGLPDKGSLFIAGEAGAELVTNMGGGQSGVMNMEQLEDAVARGMVIGLSSVDMRDDRPIYINIDGQRFFSASRDIYRKNGYDVSAIR